MRPGYWQPRAEGREGKHGVGRRLAARRVSSHGSGVGVGVGIGGTKGGGVRLRAQRTFARSSWAFSLASSRTNCAMLRSCLSTDSMLALAL